LKAKAPIDSGEIDPNDIIPVIDTEASAHTGKANKGTVGGLKSKAPMKSPRNLKAP